MLNNVELFLGEGGNIRFETIIKFKNNVYLEKYHKEHLKDKLDYGHLICFSDVIDSSDSIFYSKRLILAKSGFVINSKFQVQGHIWAFYFNDKMELLEVEEDNTYNIHYLLNFCTPYSDL